LVGTPPSEARRRDRLAHVSAVRPMLGARLRTPHHPSLAVGALRLRANAVSHRDHRQGTRATRMHGGARGRPPYSAGSVVVRGREGPSFGAALPPEGKRECQTQQSKAISRLPRPPVEGRCGSSDAPRDALGDIRDALSDIDRLPHGWGLASADAQRCMARLPTQADALGPVNCPSDREGATLH
jgi:hypothetical protein